MAVDVYFRENIEATLSSIGAAMFAAAAAHGCTNVEYCRGVYDTLRGLAVLYRCAWPTVEDDLRRVLADRGLQQLLQEAVSHSLVFSRP